MNRAIPAGRPVSCFGDPIAMALAAGLVPSLRPSRECETINIDAGSGITGEIEGMIKAIVFAAALVGLSASAQAQVELSTYADKDGYVDVQKLTCGQLANTFQEDADYLTVWYSGWYNGLAKKHAIKIDRAKTLEHEIIVYCKANQDKKVIQAIDVVFKKYRADKGIKTN